MSARLAAIVSELGADEVRVLEALAARLLEGQRAYGRLDLRHDARDWRKERGQELADALIYGAFDVVRPDGLGNGAERDARYPLFSASPRKHLRAGRVFACPVGGRWLGARCEGHGASLSTTPRSIFTCRR